MHLYESGDGLKHEKGKDTLLELSSLMTELRKIWAVIQKEDTEHIDPYGYDVRINIDSLLQRKDITLPRQPDSGRATPFHPDGVALSIKGCSYPEQRV